MNGISFRRYPIRMIVKKENVGIKLKPVPLFKAFALPGIVERAMQEPTPYANKALSHRESAIFHINVSVYDCYCHPQYLRSCEVLKSSEQSVKTLSIYISDQIRS